MSIERAFMEHSKHSQSVSNSKKLHDVCVCVSAHLRCDQQLVTNVSHIGVHR